MKLLLTLFFLLLPLGQLTELPLGFSRGRIYLSDLILALIWIWLLTKERKRLMALLRKDRLTRLLIAFSGWALFTWLINYLRWGSQSWFGLGYLIRWLLLAGPYFALKTQKSRSLNLYFIRLLKFSLLLTALLGLGQYLIFPDLRYLKYFRWDDHYYRLTGTLLDPNFMGIILVFALGVNLCFDFSLWQQLLFLSGLLLTYSRASWLAFLLMMVGWELKKGHWRRLSLFLLGFCFLILVLPRPPGAGGNLLRTFSIQARWHNWQESWQLIKKHPWLGVGFNNYQLAQPDHHKADNSFLLVWATTGIVGLILFLRLVFSWQPWWLILPIAVHSLFNNSLFYPFLLPLILIIQTKDYQFLLSGIFRKISSSLKSRRSAGFC